MAILGIFFLELINIKFLKNRKIFQYPLRQAIPLISVLIIQVIWYVYARSYNEKYNKGMFLIGILPIWEMNPDQIKMAVNAFISHIKWDYFRRETQLIFVIMFVMIMAFFRRIDKKILALVILNSVGVLFFIILFFQALEGHEYYTINLFILVPLVLISFLLLVKEKYRIVFNSIFFKIIFVVFLLHNVDFARRRMDGRYKPDGWNNKYYFRNYHALTEITPYLRFIGIEKEDRVLCLSDPGINISLYLMDQKGWTNYGIHSDSLKIEEKIKMGAKYLFLFDRGTHKEPALSSSLFSIF